MKPLRALACIALIALAACDDSVNDAPEVDATAVTPATMADIPETGLAGPRILAIGDSLMAWHSSTGRSIPPMLGEELGVPVANRAISGARILYPLPLTGAIGMRIGAQFRDGEDWDWVVMNGGGNDLWLGCGCTFCKGTLNRMISEDGQAGKIPSLVSDIRATGARVVYVGYLRSPGVNSIIDHCKDEGDILDARLTEMAAADDGVYFLSLADLVPEGDMSFHAADMIHPSLKASKTIGGMVAALIEAADEAGIEIADAG